MTVSLVVSAIMFTSGVAALLFETLWFRQAGLSFGNSVWASSLVLSSFMAGLALGNGVVAQRGDRVRHPIRLYAVLELSIAVSGVSLVWVLPGLGDWLAPLWLSSCTRERPRGARLHLSRQARSDCRASPGACSVPASWPARSCSPSR